MNGQFVHWNNYLIQVEQTNFMLKSIAMYALISAYVYTREVSCNTQNVLFSYPVSRVKIFLSKIVVVITIIFVTVVVEFLFSILGGLLLPHEALTRSIFMAHIEINLYALLIEIEILPIAIFIGLLSKNVIMPIVYSGAATFVNMFLVASRDQEIIQYVPISYPMIMFEKWFTAIGKGTGNERMVLTNAKDLLSNTSITIAILTFVIGTIACIAYYVKSDIN